MPIYLCTEHQLAFQSYRSLGAHFRFVHRSTSPVADEVEAEELPEGFTLRHPYRAPKEKEVEQVQPKVHPPSSVSVPEELPTDFIERCQISFGVHRIPPQLTEYALGTLRLHPEAQDNASNFANLMSTILGSTPSGRQHQGKIGLITLEVFGQPSAGMGYPGYMGYMGVPGGPGYTPTWPSREQGYQPVGYPPQPGYQPGYFPQHYPYPPYYPERPQGSHEGRESEVSLGTDQLKKQVEQDRQQFQEQNRQLQEEIEGLHGLLVKQEEERKAEAHRRELEESQRRYESQLAELRASQEKEIERLRQENRDTLSRLEARLDKEPKSSQSDGLREELSQLREELRKKDITALQDEIHRLRSDVTQREPPGTPTELGVIQHTADGALEALKAAGSDLKTLAGGTLARTQFQPGRRTPEEREALGGAVAERLEKSAEAGQKAKELFARG